MPMKPMEMEKLILADGWIFKNQEGSHKNYIHPVKPGKVTIPFKDVVFISGIITMSFLVFIIKFL